MERARGGGQVNAAGLPPRGRGAAPGRPLPAAQPAMRVHRPQLKENEHIQRENELLTTFAEKARQS